MWSNQAIFGEPAEIIPSDRPVDSRLPTISTGTARFLVVKRITRKTLICDVEKDVLSCELVSVEGGDFLERPRTVFFNRASGSVPTVFFFGVGVLLRVLHLLSRAWPAESWRERRRKG